MEPAYPSLQAPNVSYEGQSKRRSVIRATLIIAAVATVLGVAFWLINKDDTTGLSMPAAVVTVTDEGFSPASVKIKQGQEVMSVNKSQQGRQIMADDSVAPELDSQNFLQANESYSYPFDEKGTFPYFDPNMSEQYRGTVIVE